MALSLSTTHLLIGTPTGDIHIHALPSHQHLRTLQSHSGSITHLSTLLRPPDLISGSGKSKMTESFPLMDIKTLERMKVGRAARDLHEPVILIRPNTLQDRIDALRPPVPQRPITTSRDTGETDKVSALEAENKRLRLNLDKAIKLNERMWSGVVDLHLLPNGNTS
jgi:pre-rRNA-processing protein IPI3